MRLFAAIPVPEPARQELGSLLERLRERDWPVRWVRDEGFHLTMKFFGEVEGPGVDVLAEALRVASADIGPLSLGLAGVAALPNVSRARVICADLEGPAALELLANQIEVRCEPLGFPVEARAFRPHITLGRVRQGSRLPAEATRLLEGLALESQFLADHLVLYESQPGPAGSRYLPRASFSLR
jgi:2'-5' RNA ligase